MKLTAPLFPLLFTARGALGDGSVSEICGAISNVLGCSQKVKIPTGASLKTCPNKFFEVDSCKTRLTYRYPCPTIRQPGRMCDGWTCVAGTRETWIETPCGINIATTDIDLCDLVRRGMPGGQIVEKTEAICNCLPQALQQVPEIAASIGREGDLTAAMTALIRQSAKLQKCVLENGFNIQDNKAELIAGDLAPTNGWVVLTAAEIDTSTYIELATAVAPCVVGTCDPNLIRSFFTSYITRSQKLMGDQLVAVLEGWINIFAAVEKKVAAVVDSAEHLVARLQTVPAKLAEIQGRICRNNDACADGSPMADFFKKVSEAITTVQAFQDARTAAKTVADTAPKLVSLTQSTIQAAKTVPDGDFFLELIKSGNLAKVTNILNAFKFTTELPALVPKIQDATATLAEFVTKYGPAGRGAAAATLLAEVVSTSWAQQSNDLLEIQTLTRSEIQDPFNNLTTTIKAVGTILDTFPVKPGRFAMQPGVASYKRWSTVSGDLPCTRSKRADFEVGGFRGSFDYPEFYSCPFSARLPWPNHHIPYLKLRVQ